MKVLNDVLGYENLKIYQDPEMLSFSLDSVLLARFAKLKNSYKNICDFGTNNAIIPLILSRYTNASIDAVDIQEDASKIAKDNIELNNLQDKITVFNEDIKEFVKDKNNKYDLILCNPPFFKVSHESNLNTKSEKLIPARHETHLTLNEMIRSAAIGCKQKGKLVLIHLAERFDEIIFALKQNNFFPKRIQFIYSKENQNAKKVLIESDFQGNEGNIILPPLYVHSEDNSYNPEVMEMFKE